VKLKRENSGTAACYPTSVCRIILQAWTIDYWLNKAGAPKDKVIVGISTYGTTFTLTSPARHGLKAATTGPGKAGKYTQEPGTLAYYEVRASSISQSIQVTVLYHMAFIPPPKKTKKCISHDRKYCEIKIEE